MFLLTFEQLVKMFLIMLLAVLCYRMGLVNQEGNKSLSNLLLLVVNPCVILTVYQTDYNPVLARGLLFAFAAAIVVHIVGILVSTLLIRPSSGPDYSIDRYSAMYSNCGFIGIPLVGSVLGDTGVFYVTAYMVAFNIFTWTHGIVLMEKKCTLKNLKEGFISPMFISTIAAVALYFAQIRLPEVLVDSMQYVADMNTPLAMLIAGFSVAQSDLLKMLKKKRIYLISAFKLLLMPLLMIPVFMLMRLPYDVAITMLIATACPTAATGTMLAIRYRQNYTYASELFAMSTVLAVAAIPPVALLAETLL